jgi:hypothetical protein
MHYKTNRLNHDFQIAYFIAGSCQTADAAWSILHDLHEDRDNAIKSFEAYSMRDRAKIKRAEAILAKFVDPTTQEVLEGNGDDPDYLDALADIVELRALAETVQRNYDAALAERAFIEKCMAKLEPLRRYSHLSPAEAHEAAQHEEWKLHLVNLAQNHLLSTNHIPHDHWDTMRMHPAFENEIFPAVQKFMEVKALAGAGDKKAGLLMGQMLVKKNFDLPKMLPAPSGDQVIPVLEFKGDSNDAGNKPEANYPDYSPVSSYNGAAKA